MGKGVSATEKKKMLLKVYHTHKEPFGLKELEKFGSKAGIYEKQVKDVNSWLMDDNVVQSDKVSNVHIFWSFPAAQGVELKAAAHKAKRRLAAAEKRLAEAKEAKAQALIGREENEDGQRAAKLKKLGDLVEERRALEAKYETVKENDPLELERIQELTEHFKNNAIRWTENLMSIKSWLVKKNNIPAYQVDKLFQDAGLPKDMDLD